jgi:RNA polymerase-binding transcription factor DksA
MKTQEYKNLLVMKLREIEKDKAPSEDIVIERNAEMMDEIQQTAERELAMTTRALSWKTSIAIHAALDRVAAGSFGVCLSCDEPINERRLNALPWAGQWISCQQTQENELVLASAA